MIQQNLLSAIKLLTERNLRVHIMRHSLHGIRACFDILKTGAQIAIVFDVGANVGNVAVHFHKELAPDRIYCFEPVTSTFELLIANCARYPNFSCHRVALGSVSGESTIYLTEDSSGCSLRQSYSAQGSESVEISTVDKFAEESQISRIDLLKIDTEGFDLEVLNGAKRMLAEGRIPFVIAEVGFHPGGSKHVLLEEIRSFLGDFGYSVYGIYEQHLEWSGELRLRFANACFVNESAICRGGSTR